MTTLSIWLSVALFISSIVVLVMFWYLRRLLRRFYFISQNINDLEVMVKNYQEHLKQVYGMEAFYGDETLEYLMKHTNSLLEMLDDYQDVYDIIEPTDLLQEINDEETRNPETPEEKEEVPFPVSEENVFYAGSRRRDN